MTVHVIVEADGGSRGNPGPAGYGAVVKDAATGEVLAERSVGIGVATNNVAEYQGLVAGLEAAAELGASTVEARLDSKLVVEQMSGRWKIKHAALQPLALQARDAAARLSRVTYTWIPRAENSHADRLANEAMDTQAAGPSAPAASAPVEDPEEEAEQLSLTDSAPAAAPSDRVAPTGWTGAAGTPTRLLLVRHGQTAMSVERRYSGAGDVPLTETGQWQAQAVAKRLAELDGVRDADPVVVTSPLTRAAQTAQAVGDALGARVDTVQPLRETDFGEWEGLTFAEASQRDPEVHGRWMRATSVSPPGGENFDEVYRRVRQAQEQLFERYAGRTIVVVSHVTPIKMLLRLALDAGPSLLFRLHLDPASLSIADFYPDGNASVRLVNDISHLR
ncbi:bifunctional RNase H/acid phosphatase [Saccharomonospora sp. CUA-673]|uniref:bifunctional RNase H/acid phosphatase n=1 Tax=Saccharomonospora sp. CUA-673 TaxID=1904969 RepID=UPI000964482E|nr:bifunctional RNase H/acid phosphatase [Saccharomonospora sp. CUA-673]OLT42507.1 bifunctional RNase H/acid phosphatase [Saccharomonospora sp. CUA-673]